MRNEDTMTGQGIVPDYLRSEFDAVNEVLRQASEDLDSANKRHQAAILARIAMESDDITAELWAAKSHLDLASKHYVSAIEDRLRITDKINQRESGQLAS